MFTLLCGASNGLFMAFKALIKPFVAPQRTVRIKLNFYFNTTFRNAWDGKV